MGSASGRRYQLVEYGSKSKRFKRAGYPVLVPAHVSMTGYVRKFRFGGAAKDAHRRARSSGYAERRKYPKRRSITANRRRRSMRRRSRKNPRYVVAKNRRSRRSRRSRRNPRYVVANRRRRRMRRNQIALPGGADLMRDVLTPVAAGTAGFIGARVLSNTLANVAFLRNTLDAGVDAPAAQNTKIAANLLGILGTLGLATAVPMIRRNQGAIVTGMGLALADRLIQRFGGGAAGYLSGFGEYVRQPLGEYVRQPLGAYVADPSHGVGEYVRQPLGADDTYYAAAGLGATPMMYATAGYREGVDPANQAGVDGLMDVMEAAAGVPAMQAAAGMSADILYAAAGLGAGELPAPAMAPAGRGGIPFESIQTPVDVAEAVTAELPYDRPVSESLVTPEGRGYAGGLFARHLFAGMLSG